MEYFFIFLDASSHLYMRICPSVHRSVRRSVGPWVGHAFVENKEYPYFRANNCSRRYTRRISCNHIVIQSFHQHEDASLALWALLRVLNCFWNKNYLWIITKYLNINSNGKNMLFSQFWEISKRKVDDCNSFFAKTSVFIDYCEIEH